MKRICDQCNQSYTSRSPRFCSKTCFQQWLREQKPLEKRLWANVKESTPDKCWPWIGNADQDGYAKIWVNGHNLSVYRMVWQLTYGDIPSNKSIRHKCGNNLCCNPNHLYIDNPHDRFWAKVNIKEPSQCWLWTGSVCPDGYGVATINKQHKRTHRISWELTHGTIPKGKSVLHKCDNPPCVNPTHLFLGTQQDNITDMDAKGRRGSAIGVNNGKSKLTETDIVTIRSLHKQGMVGTKIAAQFNVHNSAIYKILNGVNWKHI
jgi:hypothetical protein